MSISKKLQADCLAYGYIGKVKHLIFYEHPVYGDECQLIVYNTISGEWSISDFWKLPDKEEI